MKAYVRTFKTKKYGVVKVSRTHFLKGGLSIFGIQLVKKKRVGGLKVKFSNGRVELIQAKGFTFDRLNNSQVEKIISKGLKK